jgi:hypothetical protein
VLDLATMTERPLAAIDVLRAPDFRAIVAAAFLLAVPTVSDGFIYLSLQRQTGIGAAAFPLFFVGASPILARGLRQRG